MAIKAAYAEHMILAGLICVGGVGYSVKRV